MDLCFDSEPGWWKPVKQAQIQGFLSRRGKALRVSKSCINEGGLYYAVKQGGTAGTISRP